MHHYFTMKLKVVSLVLSAILLIFFSNNSQVYTHIHIEFPNKFIAEFEKNVSKQ